jgi:putative Mg2+ transporter-C (MgtC) family protein
MIEANLMLGVLGKTNQSFTMMDALRFPLGILSGIGFIGAGAIVRRGSLVTGVTTAATMWLVTVIGLILGAGYLVFGGAVTTIAFLVLTVLKYAEPFLTREHRGHLMLSLDGTGPSNDDLRAMIIRAGYRITSLSISYDSRRRLTFHLEWYGRNPQDRIPEIVERLSEHDGTLIVEWQPTDIGRIFE